MKRALAIVMVLALWPLPRAHADETLYLRLGGKTGVAHIVAESVSLWMADPRVASDFGNINPDHLKMRLEEQICQITGGPCVYRGRPMKAAHAALNLTQAKFNAVAEDVQTAMDHAGIPYRTQNQLMALLAPMQRDIAVR